MTAVVHQGMSFCPLSLHVAHTIQNANAHYKQQASLHPSLYSRSVAVLSGTLAIVGYVLNTPIAVIESVASFALGSLGWLLSAVTCQRDSILTSVSNASLKYAVRSFSVLIGQCGITTLELSRSVLSQKQQRPSPTEARALSSDSAPIERRPADATPAQVAAVPALATPSGESGESEGPKGHKRSPAAFSLSGFMGWVLGASGGGGAAAGAAASASHPPVRVAAPAQGRVLLGDEFFSTSPMPDPLLHYTFTDMASYEKYINDLSYICVVRLYRDIPEVLSNKMAPDDADHASGRILLSQVRMYDGRRLIKSAQGSIEAPLRRYVQLMEIFMPIVSVDITAGLSEPKKEVISARTKKLREIKNAVQRLYLEEKRVLVTKVMYGDAFSFEKMIGLSKEQKDHLSTLCKDIVTLSGDFRKIHLYQSHRDGVRAAIEALNSPMPPV